MYINAIENDEYPEQSLNIYFRGHLKHYCEFLGLSYETVRELMETNGYKFEDPSLNPADSEKCKDQKTDRIKTNSAIAFRKNKRSYAKWLLLGISAFLIVTLISLVTKTDSSATNQITVSSKVT